MVWFVCCETDKIFLINITKTKKNIRVVRLRQWLILIHKTTDNNKKWKKFFNEHNQKQKNKVLNLLLSFIVFESLENSSPMHLSLYLYLYLCLSLYKIYLPYKQSIQTVNRTVHESTDTYQHWFTPKKTLKKIKAKSLHIQRSYQQH